MCPRDQGLNDNEIFVTPSQWEDRTGERRSDKAKGLSLSGVPGLASLAALALRQKHRGHSHEGFDT